MACSWCHTEGNLSRGWYLGLPFTALDCRAGRRWSQSGPWVSPAQRADPCRPHLPCQASGLRLSVPMGTSDKTGTPPLSLRPRASQGWLETVVTLRCSAERNTGQVGNHSLLIWITECLMSIQQIFINIISLRLWGNPWHDAYCLTMAGFLTFFFKQFNDLNIRLFFIWKKNKIFAISTSWNVTSSVLFFFNERLSPHTLCLIVCRHWIY